MTYPTRTFNKGFMNDCNTTTGWTAQIGPSLPAPTISCEYGDYIKLGGTPAGAGDESCYWEVNVTPDISGTTYKYYLLRYRTTVASDGLGARVQVRGSMGATQWIIGETNPEFSTTWKVETGTLTAFGGEDIDCVRFYADDYPDAVAAGGTYVWFDMLLISENIFSFPKCNLKVFLPERRNPTLPIWGREGGIEQSGGSEKARVHLWGEMTHESTWGTPKGQRFYQWCHEQGGDLWQWFTWADQNLKFKTKIVGKPEILFEGGKLTFDLWLEEYKLADACAVETYQERFGFI